MYYHNHNPPHFHAEYGEQQMVVDVNTFALIGGRLSPRAMGLVMELPAIQVTSFIEFHWKTRMPGRRLKELISLSAC